MIKPLSITSGDSDSHQPLSMQLNSATTMNSVNIFVKDETGDFHRGLIDQILPKVTSNLGFGFPNTTAHELPTSFMLVARYKSSVIVSMSEAASRDIIDKHLTFEAVYGIKEADVLRFVRRNNEDGLLSFANFASQITPTSLSAPNVLVKFSNGQLVGLVNTKVNQYTPPSIPLPAPGWMAMALMAMLAVGRIVVDRRRNARLQAQSICCK